MGTVGLLLLAACGGGGSGKKPSAGDPMATTTPRAGGSLTINMVADSRSLDPFTASLLGTTDYARMNAIYDVLVYADKSNTIHPQLAESFTTADDGRVWTLVLRPDVKFSDGTPLDAAAVKFTWDKVADPAMRSPHASSARGLTTEVVDPRTLRVTLTEPNRRFNQVVAANLAFVASPTAYGKDPQGFSRKPVGAGPFVLKEWADGDHQTFTRNPTYWQPGRPYLDEVTFQVVTDQIQALGSVQNGQSDLVLTVDARSAGKARDAGMDITSIGLNGSMGVMFNNKRPPFDDVRARQALTLAIDRDAYNKIVYEGDGTPAHGLFVTDSPLVDHAAIPPMNTDLQRAKDLAKQLADEGKPLKFSLVMPQSAGSFRHAEYLKQQWSSLPGADVQVEYVDIVASITRTQVNRDYQAMFAQWMTSGEPTLWNYLYSDSPSNYLGFSSPAADAALKESRAATSPEQLKTAYTRLAQIVAEEVPIVPLQESVFYAYAQPGKVGGVEFTNSAALLMDRIGLLNP